MNLMVKTGLFFFFWGRGNSVTLTPVEIISRVTVLMSLDDHLFPAAPISFKFSSSHLGSFKCGGESSLSGRQRTCSPVNLFPSPLLLCSVFVLSSSPFKFSHLNSFSASYFPPLPLSLTHRPLHNPSLIKVTPVPALSPEPSLVTLLTVESRLHLAMTHRKDLQFPVISKEQGLWQADMFWLEMLSGMSAITRRNVLFLLIFLMSKSDRLLFQINHGFPGREKGLDTMLFGPVNRN